MPPFNDSAQFNLNELPSVLNRRRSAIGIARTVYRRWLMLALAFIACLGNLAFARPDVAITAVAALTDPAKLATLKSNRAANDRLLKCVYWLHDARGRGLAPEKVIEQAQKTTNRHRAHSNLVRASLLRNLEIAGKLGCLTAPNAARMRHGKSPVISRGPYAGEPAEVDHIIPVALAPELGNELANLELMPRTLNRRKGRKVGARQVAYAGKFAAAGILKPQTVARILVSQ